MRNHQPDLMLSQDCLVKEYHNQEVKETKRTSERSKSNKLSKVDETGRKKIKTNRLQNARTTGKVAPIVNMVLYQSNHICGMLFKLSTPIETSLPVQDVECKFQALNNETEGIKTFEFS